MPAPPRRPATANGCHSVYLVSDRRGGTPRERVRTLFLTGVAVVVPVAVSAWVLLAIVRWVGSTLSPVGAFLRRAGVESDASLVLLQLASLVLVGVLLVLVGAFVQLRFGRRLIERVDGALSSLPGLGTVYGTARQMSDVVLDPNGDGADSEFRDVRLVAFPSRDAYTLGFLTTESPPETVVATARALDGDPDGEYCTMFLPMAPNPFMGGQLTHVPADRVHAVDLSVEEAAQYILTTGMVDGTAES